jgi:diaminopimelate epimerase
MELHFTKMHGLGNDFVMIEDLDEALDLAPEAVAWLCDRHFGIGSDGLILVRPGAGDADFFMAYHNADGSVAEMCGNGIRCFAKYVVDRELVASDADSIVVGTLGGDKPIEITRDYDGSMHMATVDMGAPILDPDEIPTTLAGEQVYGCPLETDLGTFEITAVSMGNPHAILWVEDVNDAPVDTVGPIIENHEAFPMKTNVEFAQLAGDEHVLLRVWERGVGETLACGTGACATLVAAALGCLVGRSATVELPGGELQIRWDENDHVYMTGPAREVFTGTVHVPEEDDD